MELDEFLTFVSANDELGLLDVKAKTSAPTDAEHLYTKFNEINEFVKKSMNSSKKPTNPQGNSSRRTYESLQKLENSKTNQ